MKPDGPLTKADMRYAAQLLEAHAVYLWHAHTLPSDRRMWSDPVTHAEYDDMQRLARQLYAKAREPKP
jgi:hypothetical protein